MIVGSNISEKQLRSIAENVCTHHMFSRILNFLFVIVCLRGNKTQRIESKIARKWLLKLKMFKKLYSQNSQNSLSSLHSLKTQNPNHAKSRFLNTHMAQNDAIISILVTQKNTLRCLDLS